MKEGLRLNNEQMSEKEKEFTESREQQMEEAHGWEMDENNRLRIQAEKINSKRSLWEKITGKNKVPTDTVSSIDMLNAEALAIEKERAARQAEMDQADIAAIKEKISDTLGGTQEVGDNSAVAITIDNERSRVREKENEKFEKRRKKNKDDDDSGPTGNIAIDMMMNFDS